jgi:hypothetical protein
MADMADFKQSREVGNLTVKLDVDASDAIRALKALQREARKATQALRELEAEVAKAKIADIRKQAPVWLETGYGDVTIHYTGKDGVPRSARLAGNVDIGVFKRESVIPEMKVDDKADVEKIAKELVDDVFERLEREQYRDFIERENE